MRREYAGIAVLVLAAAVALPFVLFKGESDLPEPLPVGTEVPTYTATAAPPSPTPTATPVPDRGALPSPQFWSVTFYRDVSGIRDDDDTIFAESLDFEFDGPPFGEYRDGAWGLFASASWGARPAGRYHLTLEFDCALTIRLGETVIVEESDPQAAAGHSWDFLHDGGPLGLTIDAAAAPGHFLIRWR